MRTTIGAVSVVLLALCSGTGLADVTPLQQEQKLDCACSIAEYMDIGQRNPGWDDLVREGLEQELLKEDCLNARKSFQKAYDLGCRDMELLYRLGECCMRTAGHVQGEKYLSMAAEMYPQARGTRIHAARPDILLGDYYYGLVKGQATDPVRALEHYKRVNAQAKITEIQNLVYRARKAQDALTDLEKQFKEHPTAATAFQVAEQYGTLSKFPEEALWLDKTLALDPEHGQALVRRIDCARLLSDFDKGEAFISRAISAAEKANDLLLLSRAHQAAGHVLIMHGLADFVPEVRDPRGEPAHQHALAAVEAARRCNNDERLYNALWTLAQSYWCWSGKWRYDLAIVQLNEALALAQKHGWEEAIRLTKGRLSVEVL